MSEKDIPIGARVELTDKGGLIGVVGFFGETQFNANGKWVGVVLDEPVGKNNGTVQGVSYFQCEANHGIFVRPGQITLLDGEASPRTPASSGLKKPTASGKVPHSASKLSRPLSSARKGESGLAKPGSRIRAPGKTGVSPAPSVERIKASASQSSLRSSPSSERLSNKSSPSTEKLPTSSSKEKLKPESAKSSTVPPSQMATPKTAKAMAAEVTETPHLPQSGGVAQKVAALKADTAARRASGEGILSSGTLMSEAAELEYLRSEKTDLGEKLETLRTKRAEDKAKLQDYERCRIQLQSLLEYKGQMSAAHSDLQRQLLEAKAEAKEALAAKAAVQEDASGTTEIVEMATLDKEMAEEKAELLQQELESYKERVQELEMDLEIARAEMEEGVQASGSPGKPAAADGVQVKQMTTQIERLKEALVKMRDLSAHNSDENIRLSKENEAMKAQVLEINRKMEKMTTETAEAQATMTDLQEQVDAALGSEKMVEELAEKALELEERLKEVQEAHDDLESMRLMDEEMAENQRDLEKELRQELDLAAGRFATLAQDLRDANARSSDLEETIKKFRHKVAEQQEAMEDYKDQIRIAEDHLNQTEEEIMELGEAVVPAKGPPASFASSKALADSVDAELARLDLDSATTGIKYLGSFLPDNFFKAAGDNDAVRLCLLFPRLESKTELLAKHILARFPRQLDMRREHVTKSHKGEQWAFAARAHYYLNSLATVLNRFQSVLERCSVERLLRLAALYPEAVVQERGLDTYFQLLKTNRLDENTSLDQLHKVIHYFTNIYTVHVPKEEYNGSKFVSNTVRQLLSGTYWFRTEVQRLRFYLLSGEEESAVGRQLAELELFIGEAESLCVRAKNRLPDSKTASLALPATAEEGLAEARAQVEKAAAVLSAAAAVASSQVSMLPDVEGVSSGRLLEFLAQGAVKVDGRQEGSPEELLKTCLGLLIGPLSKTAEAIESKAWEKPPPESQPFPPVLERAHARKQAGVEAEGLRWQMEKKEAELMDAKKAIRAKADEISEMRIRLEMSEKKASQTNEAGDQRLVQTQKTIDELRDDLKKQKRDSERAQDAQAADIDALEKQVTELKENNKRLSKKALLHGISEAAGLASPTIAVPASPFASAGPVSESPLLLAQIRSLRGALEAASTDAARLRGAEMLRTMKSLTPLNVPKNPLWLRRLGTGQTPETTTSGEPTRHEEAAKIAREVERFTKAYVAHAASIRLPSLSGPKVDPYGEIRARHLRERELRWWRSDLAARLTRLRAAQLPGFAAVCDFADFPAGHFKEGDGQRIATLKLKKGLADETNGPTLVQFTPETFRRFHNSLIT